MTIKYDFGDDGHEFDTDFDAEDYADFLSKCYFHGKSKEELENKITDVIGEIEKEGKENG